jgi:hypothetical protein
MRKSTVGSFLVFSNDPDAYDRLWSQLWFKSLQELGVITFPSCAQRMISSSAAGRKARLHYQVLIRSGGLLRWPIV